MRQKEIDSKHYQQVESFTTKKRDDRSHPLMSVHSAPYDLFHFFKVNIGNF